MNLYLLLTRKMAQKGYRMAPENNILGLTGPNEFSNNIKMSKTNISTIGNWFSCIKPN